MVGIGEVMDILKPRVQSDSIEIAEVKSVKPLILNIAGQEYNSKHFKMYLPRSLYIKEKKKLKVENSEVIYNKNDYTLEFDEEKSVELKVGDLLCVVDKGASIIILSVIKGG